MGEQPPSRTPRRLLAGGCLIWIWGIAMSSSAGSYHVETHADAPEPVAFAAKELARYCQKATGEAVAVVTAEHGVHRHAVMLARGGADPAATSPAAKRAEALGADGFVATSLPDAIVLAGASPRGTLFAVYWFLEDRLGCRWYVPDPQDQIVPSLGPGALDRVMEQGVDVSERPDFAFRQREFRDINPVTDATDDRILEQIDWWAKLRMNCFLVNFNYATNAKLWQRWETKLFPEVKRRGLLLGIGEHGSYPLFLPPEQYGQEHPEWYCEVDGKRITAWSLPGRGLLQFCTTNPDAVRTYLDNFVRFVRENPEIDIYYPAPNDGARWCECRTCRELSVADRYLVLDNQVAHALAGVRPDCRIIHLAYSNHRLPPERTDPEPVIDVDVACWGRDFAYPLTDPRTMPGRADYLTVFREWLKRCRAVAERSAGGGEPPGPRVLYHCKFMRHLWLGPHLLPLPVLDADMPYLRDLGIDGFDFPLGFVGIWTKALNAYVTARKCWDADADSAAMVDEFFRLTFGPEARTARRACELLEEALPHLRYGSNHSLLWSEGLLAPRMENAEDLTERLQASVEKLQQAVTLASSAVERTAETPHRHNLRKLLVALSRIHREQTVLLAFARVADLAERAGGGDVGDAGVGLLPKGRALLESADRVVQDMERAYRLSDDLAGLYWAGATHGTLRNALAKWRTFADDILVGFVWWDAATWETTDFPDKDTVISKEIDVTPHLRQPGPLFVRWQWTGGQLGITIRETSLWRVVGEERTCVSRDAHGGFAGARDRRSFYRLSLNEVDPAARYAVVGRIQACAAHGTVAERGCFGKTILGTRAQGQQ